MIFPSEIITVKNLYESGLSVRKVSEVSELTKKQINLRLDKAGVERRDSSLCHRKYFFNEDFFADIDTEEKAYWLGFLVADGCLIDLNNKFHLVVRLSGKDKGHLQKLLDSMKATYPVRNNINNKGYRVSSITLSSKKLFSHLVDKGLMPRKTFKLEAPTKVPLPLINHWIRGYFDGDGTVYTPSRNPKTLSVCIFARAGVLSFIKYNCGIDRPIRSRKNIFIYKMGKKEHVMKFAAYIYRDATIFLNRKYERFYKWLTFDPIIITD